mmetsp:Transcript_18692/g.72111  ORF Transcript_18692/g.72111 Transcript_18692/m.72111 type:complete len:243 (-) Transcript_18692:116-844(-)
MYPFAPSCHGRVHVRGGYAAALRGARGQQGRRGADDIPLRHQHGQRAAPLRPPDGGFLRRRARERAGHQRPHSAALQRIHRRRRLHVHAAQLQRSRPLHPRPHRPPRTHRLRLPRRRPSLQPLARTRQGGCFVAGQQGADGAGCGGVRGPPGERAGAGCAPASAGAGGRGPGAAGRQAGPHPAARGGLRRPPRGMPPPRREAPPARGRRGRIRPHAPAPRRRRRRCAVCHGPPRARRRRQQG